MTMLCGDSTETAGTCKALKTCPGIGRNGHNGGKLFFAQKSLGVKYEDANLQI